MELEFTKFSTLRKTNKNQISVVVAAAESLNSLKLLISDMAFKRPLKSTSSSLLCSSRHSVSLSKRKLMCSRLLKIWQRCATTTKRKHTSRSSLIGSKVKKINIIQFFIFLCSSLVFWNYCNLDKEKFLLFYI